MEQYAIFFAGDQFLESCSRELYLHLKRNTFKTLAEMPKGAGLIAEALCGVYTCVNKAQGNTKGGTKHKS